jgi:hypothetical protein
MEIEPQDMAVTSSAEFIDFQLESHMFCQESELLNSGET